MATNNIDMQEGEVITAASLARSVHRRPAYSPRGLPPKDRDRAREMFVGPPCRRVVCSPTREWRGDLGGGDCLAYALAVGRVLRERTSGKDRESAVLDTAALNEGMCQERRRMAQAHRHVSETDSWGSTMTTGLDDKTAPWNRTEGWTAAACVSDIGETAAARFAFYCTHVVERSYLRDIFPDPARPRRWLGDSELSALTRHCTNTAVLQVNPSFAPSRLFIGGSVRLLHRLDRRLPGMEIVATLAEHVRSVEDSVRRTLPGNRLVPLLIIRWTGNHYVALGDATELYFVITQQRE